MISKPATLTSDSGAPVVLRSVKASGRLSGLLLTMTLHQTFRNDEAQHIEVTYTFPLPWGAVLTGLEATLGDKRMRGRVMARRQAAQKYEDAVEQGDAPVMVAKNEDGSFTASLGSLKPGEQATVELSYAQVLNFEQGRVRLVVPTTIAPRYGDAVADGGLLPHHAAPANLLVEHAFGLELTISGVLARAHLSCPSHQVTQQHGTDEVRLATGGPAWLDRDFVVVMEGLEGQSLAVAGLDPAAGEGRFAMIASFCPKKVVRPEPALSLKILVDCSGSMSGDSIHQARAALNALAASLKLGDRFTYSRFGSTPQPVLAPTSASDQGRHLLRIAIHRTQADLGGTEMGAAFDHVFDLRFPDAPDAPQADVLVITDGAVWGVQNILERTLRSGHRIYALGVGSAPAASLLSELAEETGGACEFATPNEDMVAAMRRLMTRMRSASVVQTSMNVDPPPLWHSPLPRRITDDETVHVHMRLPARPSAAPLLRIDDEESTRPEITWLPDDLVARIVAARQVGYTADQASAAAIGERYQLVTDHTNLLLVFQRAESEKTDGMPALRQVQPMVAAGAGGFGRVQALSGTRTGTDSVPVFAPAHLAMRVDPSASVWRKARARVDALDSSSLEEIDIPAFLRRQDNVQSRLRPPTSSAPSMRFGVERRADHAAGPADAAESARLAAHEIVRAFSGAVQPGLSFRQVLRIVTERVPNRQIVVVVALSKHHVGSLIKAWACFLMWVHQLNVPEARLSDAALALVEGQLKQLDIQERQSAMGLFDAIAA